MKEINIPASVRSIGFDLDDTLHHFRRASGVAADSVFEYISDEFGTPVDSLKTSYQSILKEGQSGHFTVTRPSREYRAERFGKLLNRHSILTPGHLDRILEVYDDALANNLALTTGAENVLKAARKKGWGIFVVSEGPHDAQETTLERLGIRKYIDTLITSSQEGLSKSDGLFSRALEKIGRASNEVVYVGDSLERDIIPASALSITAIQLTSNPSQDYPAIASMQEMADIIEKI